MVTFALCLFCLSVGFGSIIGTIVWRLWLEEDNEAEIRRLDQTVAHLEYQLAQARAASQPAPLIPIPSPARARIPVPIATPRPSLRRQTVKEVPRGNTPPSWDSAKGPVGDRPTVLRRNIHTGEIDELPGPPPRPPEHPPVSRYRVEVTYRGPKKR